MIDTTRIDYYRERASDYLAWIRAKNGSYDWITPGEVLGMLDELEVLHKRIDEVLILCNEGAGDPEANAYLMHVKAIIEGTADAKTSF